MTRRPYVTNADRLLPAERAAHTCMERARERHHRTLIRERARRDVHAALQRLSSDEADIYRRAAIAALCSNSGRVVRETADDLQAEIKRIFGDLA